MKTNPDFILREIAGEHILVPCGAATQNISGLINLNETAAFIWKQIDITKDINVIIEHVIAEFDVDPEVAAKDVNGLISELVQMNMILMSNE